MTGTPRPTVVFVSGWGRSGSTVLEVLLDRLPGTVGVGEVWNLWGKGFTRAEPCSCGRPVPDCPFWHEVAVGAFGGVAEVQGRATAQRMRRVARIRALPRLLRHRPPPPGSELATYVDQLGALYRGVAEVSGASVVIDTSKNAQHGFVLRHVDGIDLVVLHLVRDARAVAFSWTRRRAKGPDDPRLLPRFSPARSGVAWTTANLLTELLVAVSPRTIRVRYEDLCADPLATLGRITQATDQPAPTAAVLDPDVVRPPTHAATGNPMRHDHGPVVLNVDDEWTARPWRGRRLVTALGAPLLLRYGYRLRVGR